ncbi:MAG: DUF3723 domain-containing protein [Spirochaetaceae bacterium]|jgi:uncharacterized protein (DUF697 family)|nr:DUF3723 domain-containing protein [Spirochaetaceae bacterium]
MSNDDKTPQTTVKGQANKSSNIGDPKKNTLKQIIKNRALLAAGLGFMPVPGLNLISTTAIQISMVQSIASLCKEEFKSNPDMYTLKTDKYWIKNIITSVLGGLAGSGGSGVLAKGLLNVPLVGLPLAALTGPALHGITTYAVGHMFFCYFDSGDGFLKANTDAFAQWFEEGIKEAREKLGDFIAGKQKTAMF